MEEVNIKVYSNLTKLSIPKFVLFFAHHEYNIAYKLNLRQKSQVLFFSLKKCDGKESIYFTGIKN